MLDTKHLLFPSSFPPITREALHTLQVNLGYLCNQSCVHCHVNAGPQRKELMTLETINQVLLFIQQNTIKCLDLTGGAPELNIHFRYLVSEARKLGVEVIDRCNLTVLQEPGQEDLAQFLAQQQVTVVASMPCYLEENVDQQRGKGVFQKSIEGLLELNALGYGKGDARRPLNLVFNPQGPSLPPEQFELEKDFKRLLSEQYAVTFDQLFTITNMPINRFGSFLVSKGEFDPYLGVLRDAFQLSNLSSVMCKHLISIDWMGYVYDCDFNQQLEMPLVLNDQAKPHIKDLSVVEWQDLPISVAEHCYGCTAGNGSSCGGALV